MNSKVVDYIVEEVRRQGHDVSSLDGIERVGWMIDAWCYALFLHQREVPVCGRDIITIGQKIEPIKNKIGIRISGVRVGNRICPPAEKVRDLLDEVMGSHVVLPYEPLDFYRNLLTIHPFIDGNGRTGKVVLNWLNGTLLDPVFPPADFWGYPITNP